MKFNAMRTPEQIETEIDRIRSKMDSTLSELEVRLTPRELMRDGIESVSHLDAGRYAFKLASLARRYPMPAAFAGAGLAGIFLAGRQQYRRRSERSQVADTGSARLSAVAQTARDKLQETKQTLAQSAGTARAKLSGATSSAMERAGDIAGSAGKQLRKAGASAQTVARERPMAVGAVALAVAAAVAMCVPSVRRRIY